MINDQNYNIFVTESKFNRIKLNQNQSSYNKLKSIPNPI